jgi:hypothetical protein
MAITRHRDSSSLSLRWASDHCLWSMPYIWKGIALMAKADYYFGKSTIPQMGRMFYLRFPIAINDMSRADNLLGSIVREGDYGLFKEYPIPEHSHIPQSALKAMVALGKYSEAELVQQQTLAVPVTSVDINKSIGVNGKGAAPGVPVSVGLEINYKKLKTIDVDFGGSAIKRYLTHDPAAECYAEMGKNMTKYPLAFFNNDRMLVDRIVIVRNLSITVTSKVDFSVGLKASLTAAQEVGGGISYNNVTTRSYTLKLDGTQPYLFGLGAVQADKWIDDR